MTEFDDFERQVAAGLVIDADGAVPTFDATAIARTAIARGRVGPLRLRWRSPSLAVTGFAAAAVAMLAIVLLAELLRPRLPSSGGPSASPGTTSSPIGTVNPIAPPVGAWVPAPDMASARSEGFVAVGLLDGRVLVTGFDLNHGSAEIYDPRGETWTTTASPTELRVGATATLLGDGRVLLTGGLRGPASIEGGEVIFEPALASAELFDPRTGTWSVAASMLQARSDHSATLLRDGRVLVAGGVAPESVPYPRFSSTEIFDPETGTWSSGPSMLGRRDGHSATLLPDGRVLIAGGSDNDRLSTAELFNPFDGTWVSAPALPEAFYGHAATLLHDGSVLIVGGDVPRGPGAAGSAHAAIYDPVGDTWTLTGSLSTPRIAHQATLLRDGRVLVTGGSKVSLPTDSVFDSAEIYDPTTAAWTTVAPMTLARAGHAAVRLLDGRVLVVGGYTGDADTATAELFLP